MILTSLLSWYLGDREEVMCMLRTVLIPKQNLAVMKTSLSFKALAYIHSFQAVF